MEKRKNQYSCEICSSLFERRTDTHNTSLKKHNKCICNSCISKIKYEENEAFKKSHEEAVRLASESRHKRGEERKVTVCCGICNKEFVVPYGCRDRLYCSRSCQSKAIKRTDSRKNSICLECNKSFDHYGSRILCSRECNALYASKQRIGENNPAFKENVKSVCLGCNKEFLYNRSGMQKDSVRKFCSINCFRGNQDKNDKTTAQKNPYPKEFRKIKKYIREKYNNVCLLCGNEDEVKLSVHHIDYNKNNCCEQNLIPLCRSCHGHTNSNDQHFWRTVFSVILSNSKLVKKTWGFESHICNHCDYCLKYLVFYKDKYFSNHYHCIKKELWHCLVGEFEVILTDLDGTQNYFILKEGEKLEIERKVVHQIRALKHSILTEVSTQSFDEDSYREYPSCLGI